MSPKARQAKGQARLTAYEKLLSQEVEKRREEQEIYIPPGPRLGDMVFEFKITKWFDDRLILEISAPTSRPAPSSASSAPMAPARPPCSG